jgi:hypothetical protein
MSSNLLDYNLVKRLKETVKIVKLLLKEKLNNFKIYILARLVSSIDKLVAVKDYLNYNRTKYNLEPLQTTCNNLKNCLEYKRKLSSIKEESNLRATKKLKAFLAKLTKVQTVTKIDALKIGFAIVVLKEGDIEVIVPLLKTY